MIFDFWSQICFISIKNSRELIWTTTKFRTSIRTFLTFLWTKCTFCGWAEIFASLAALTRNRKWMSWFERFKVKIAKMTNFENFWSWKWKERPFWSEMEGIRWLEIGFGTWVLRFWLFWSVIWQLLWFKNWNYVKNGSRNCPGLFTFTISE